MRMDPGHWSRPLSLILKKLRSSDQVIIMNQGTPKSPCLGFYLLWFDQLLPEPSKIC